MIRDTARAICGMRLPVFRFTTRIAQDTNAAA
jgi:hypothetical protein